MSMKRMIRLAVFSTYVCAASSAQMLGLEVVTLAEKASAWHTHLRELTPLVQPRIRSAIRPAKLLSRVLALCTRMQTGTGSLRTVG